MTSLIEVLAQFTLDRPLLVTPEGTVHCGELLELAEQLRPRLAGTCIVLHNSSLRQAMPFVIAAEGVAASLAFVSPMMPETTFVHLISKITPNVILTDAPDNLREPMLEAGIEAALSAHVTEILSLPPATIRQLGETDWILSTSGTTGTPKLVRHGLASLTRTTRTDQALGSTQVWGLLYDYTRFAGLQVVLQSLLSGATLVQPDLSAPLAEQIAFLRDHGCTHLSATPTLWRKILMTPGAEKLSLRQITLGGEIADDTVLGSLARTYPNARISHIFASTEAGVGFSVTDRRAGFPASFLTAPPATIGLKIEDGRLWVRNELVRAQYLGGDETFAQEGWVDTGDAVIQIENRVFFRGRESGVINVGGNKVHPEEVERAILAHGNIVSARVYAKSNPITGALVAADIVPAETAGPSLKASLNEFLRKHLERHAVPAFVRIVESLEINAAGKIKRGG